MEDRRRYSDRRRVDREHGANALLYVVFSCGEYRLAVAKDDVLAISTLPTLVPMPFSRSWFAGVASIHGYVANITDLSDYLGMAAALEQEANRVLLFKQGSDYCGLIVDAVSGVIECQPCERPRSFYPLDIEQYMQGQRCADGECYDEFDIYKLLAEQRFLDAIDDTKVAKLGGSKQDSGAS